MRKLLLAIAIVILQDMGGAAPDASMV